MARKYKNIYIQNAVEELESYKSLEKTIASLSKQKKLIEERIHGISAVDYDKVCVQGNPPSKDVIETYIDIQAKTSKLEAEKDTLKMIIEVKLDMLETCEKQVLQMYYVDGRSIYEISESFKYSERWVIAMKRKALESYSKLFL